MAALLEIESLAKSYDKALVLSGLSLSLTPGKNLLLTGPSGCGKSTLLRLIAGLEGLDQGTIRIDGRIVSDGRKMVIAPRDRGLALVFQDLGLWPNLTALENVMLGLTGTKISRQEKVRQARSTLEFCEIAHKADKYPFRLSAGEQQRVALARAMAPRSKLLLLDEPFTGLDLIVKNALRRQLCRFSEEWGTTLLLVSHNPFDASSMSAEIAVLEEGRIFETGPLEQLQAQPRSRTLQAWKAEMLSLHQ
jgi:ABC-type Fe3+/spermidine/putrescine transport system ATPase subunit